MRNTLLLNTFITENDKIERMIMSLTSISLLMVKFSMLWNILTIPNMKIKYNHIIHVDRTDFSSNAPQDIFHEAFKCCFHIA